MSAWGGGGLMGEGSHIQWTHHTFNPWRGCTHVSPGCEHCYAEALSKRNPATLGTWGANGERVMAAESYWRQPERWNRAAEKAGERHRVFCASLADVFEDRPELWDPRVRLFSLIARTPHLDWLLLTKRPENAKKLIGGAAMWCDVDQGLHYDGFDLVDAWPWPNVWLGTTVEDQRRADERIPVLLDTPAAVRFLSCEPLLGPVDLDVHLPAAPNGYHCERGDHEWSGPALTDPCIQCGLERDRPYIDWLIVGGESGPKARPMDLAWARSLVEQGRAAGVATFVKQLGARPVWRTRAQQEPGRSATPWATRHRAGGDPDEWPADLRVREFPS